MQTYVAFLRAINVAGHAIVKMTDLRDAFAAAGCKNVRTYIQSGNVIFDCPQEKSAAIFKRIRTKLRALLGNEPGILFRTLEEIDALVKAAPFRDFIAERAIKLYVAFLSEKPHTKPKLPLASPKEFVEAIAMNDFEIFIVSHPKPNGFFGFPNNFIEKELGVSATSRNWSTVTKIVAFARLAQ
jgi:uncharacterized protein (DUF1697 family)